MDQSRILVVVGNVNAQEVNIDGMFLPHAVKQHHHLDVVVYCDVDVGVPHNGHAHPERETSIEPEWCCCVLIKADGVVFSF